MHRSRLSVLAIFAAVAACSTHDDPQGSAILSNDSTLVARLEKDKQPQQPVLPGACPTVAAAAQPAAASRREADELTRRAYDAEMLGNVQEARALLTRASKLDATNKSAVYHLGLTSETLGDRTAAIAAYCRYLTLAPTTAESAEARQRVAKLAQAETRVAAGSVAESVASPRRVTTAAARHVTSERRTSEPRVVASASVARPAPPASPERDTPSATSSAADVGRPSDGPSAGSDGATPASASSTDQPAPPTPTVRRGPSRTQSAIIGAAAGAIIGGAAGRSVKGAVIGAAAGGMLGTVVGSARPMGGGFGS